VINTRTNLWKILFGQVSSPSLSVSPSASISPSASVSPSASLSASVSPSASLSVSVSPSASISPSSSTSPSSSPSPGYAEYTKGDYVSLPTDDADLENAYSAQDYIDATIIDNILVNQSATGQYAVHQFKNYTGSLTGVKLNWYGKTNVAGTWSTIYLQIYNRVSPGWQTVDSNNTVAEATGFAMSATIPDENLINYRDNNSVISCRVYQLSV